MTVGRAGDVASREAPATGGTRIRAKKTAAMAKLAASTAIAHPAPTAATTMPAPVKPNTIAILVTSRRHEMARCSNRGGTTCEVTA